jgi:hypothetical protein
MASLDDILHACHSRRAVEERVRCACAGAPFKAFLICLYLDDYDLCPPMGLS